MNTFITLINAALTTTKVLINVQHTLQILKTNLTGVGHRVWVGNVG